MIDGKKIKKYSDTDDKDTHIKFSKYKDLIYNIITDNNFPTKINLKLFVKLDLKFLSSYNINISYDNEKITIVTGVAYRVFTTDKDEEFMLDSRFKQMLKNNKLLFEEN